MRQFSDTAPKPVSLLHQRIEFWWYAIMPVLVIAAIGTFGAWAGFQYYRSSNENSAIHKIQEERTLKLDSTNPESAFLEEYIKTKGSSVLNPPENVRISGTYTGKEGIQVFSGSFDFKGNGTFRLEFTETVELEYIDKVLISKVPPLFESDAALIGAFIDAMQDPLVTLKQTDNTEALLKVELAPYMGIDAVRAQIDAPELQLHTTLTVSASSLTILERLNNSSIIQASKYRYSDYKLFEGIHLPHVISIKDQLGELHRFNISRLSVAGEELGALAKR